MKKIKLQDWAARQYDPPPSMWTLRRWCRDGEISPMPEKVGKTYYVREDARRMTGAPLSLVDRLRAA
jgi:predicted site-specific integrase-resolvase